MLFCFMNCVEKEIGAKLKIVFVKVIKIEARNDIPYFFVLIQKRNKKNQGWIFFLTLSHFKNTIQKKLALDVVSLFFDASAPFLLF